MTPEQIAEARKIIDAATPGPWRHAPARKNEQATVFSTKEFEESGDPWAVPKIHIIEDRERNWFLQLSDADAEFIAAAREGWPKALDEVERLNRIIAQELVEDDSLGSEFVYVMALKDENRKLRAVAKAVEDYIELCAEVSQPWRMNDDLENALKAWKESK